MSSGMDTAFNTQLLNLLKDLNRMYPADADIAFVKKTVFLASTTYPEKPRKLFKKFIPEYEKYVVERDEEFFLSHEDYWENSKKGDWSVMLIEKLKIYWSDMDDETKNNVWLYLNVLVKLSHK